MVAPAGRVRLTLFVAALTLVGLLAMPATAQDFEKGLEAAQRGDYAIALREWRPLAKQGHAEALYNLGVMYAMGQGVPEDAGKAGTWYRSAAEQGYAKAQFALGGMYKNGHGVRQDYVQALMWYNLAVARGMTSAALFRDLVTKKMPPADVSKAERLARDWLEQHQK